MSVGFVKKWEASKQSAKSHNSLFALQDLYEDASYCAGATSNAFCTITSDYYLPSTLNSIHQCSNFFDQITSHLSRDCINNIHSVLIPIPPPPHSAQFLISPIASHFWCQFISLTPRNISRFSMSIEPKPHEHNSDKGAVTGLAPAVYPFLYKTPS